MMVGLITDNFNATLRDKSSGGCSDRVVDISLRQFKIYFGDFSEHKDKKCPIGRYNMQQSQNFCVGKLGRESARDLKSAAGSGAARIREELTDPLESGSF
ncbi:MAG: hypothetical protein AAF311_00675 [Pseudomonadota bacterium]